MTRPCRRMTLHFSHIFLTLGRTFMTLLLRSLVAVRDATSGEVVRGELYLHLVPRQDPDVVHPHLPGDVRQDLVAVVQLDAEHGVRERLQDRALEHDGVFLGLGQDGLLTGDGAGTWPGGASPGRLGTDERNERTADRPASDAIGPELQPHGTTPPVDAPQHPGGGAPCTGTRGEAARRHGAGRRCQALASSTAVVRRRKTSSASPTPS